MKNCYHAKNNHKKAKVATLISNKIDIKTINYTTHEKRYFVRGKGLYMTIISIHTPNNRTPKYTHTQKMKGEIENSAILADLNILLLIIL